MSLASKEVTFLTSSLSEESIDTSKDDYNLLLDRVKACTGPAWVVQSNQAPRFKRNWVEASKSEPNWAKAATSRYWARKSFKLPATCFMALIWAAEPTRLTERPTLIAGRTTTRTIQLPRRFVRQWWKSHWWECTRKHHPLRFNNRQSSQTAPPGSCSSWRHVQVNGNVSRKHLGVRFTTRVYEVTRTFDGMPRLVLLKSS